VARSYQIRGAGWLATMSDLGLGACLADDMGLGKTVQLLVLLLHRMRSGSTAPSLLVCPTSVVGNWERELKRFAPSMAFVRHYGSQRARDAESFANLAPGTVVFTTYGLLRRDWQTLSEVEWAVAALDEAQNIKNSASRTAQAARALKAEFRVALTGTPVENRLAELWSIFEFLNPRFLGPQAEFRRTYAIPIERYGQAEVAEQLKRLTQPFILRRLKSDPAIIQDLPSKQEMKIICSLTREQASLYQAALDESLAKIEESEGIERRGQVLALLTALKQICNHPAQYLGEAGPLANRSGKLQRIVEMLEEAIAGGDRALVFTQYREMGDRLVDEFHRVFGLDVPFLHGGVPQASRDEMVRKFQDDPRSPPIFVLSVKAGGTGLNLTAANHVFHYDRWWNPAVEDQATDRAYRIGQQRSVQVHKFLCAGTVEDKIDQLLERKRQLADSIVGAGEQWITELDDSELRDLFSLAPDAVISEDIAEADTSAEMPDTEAAPKKRGRRRREVSA
jgi:SNF2 family DNA or RNA helicase